MNNYISFDIRSYILSLLLLVIEALARVTHLRITVVSAALKTIMSLCFGWTHLIGRPTSLLVKNKFYDFFVFKRWQIL